MLGGGFFGGDLAFGFLFGFGETLTGVAVFGLPAAFGYRESIP
jgi:hypothetical protein